MLSIGKRREFLLKLLCTGALLFALSFLSWGAVWLGAISIFIIIVLLHYQSTNWILKKLDLGPELINTDDLRLKGTIELLAKKYEINKPKLFLSNSPTPLVMGLGDRENGAIILSKLFFNKLSPEEKKALLELSFVKIESGFCKNIEFVTHLNSLIMYVGSKMDLIIAIIIGIKRNKEIEKYNYILFSRFSLIFIRIINYFYMNKKVFLKFDETTYQNNPHLILALNKTMIYSPLDKKGISPLLMPFNFCNFPRYVSWHRYLEIQPQIETRLNTLQKDKNLMLESLTI